MTSRSVTSPSVRPSGASHRRGIVSDDGPAYPPEAEAAEHDGQAEEDRQFGPLHGPVAAAWLVGHQLVERGGEPGGAPPGIQRAVVAQGTCPAEEGCRRGMAGLVDNFGRIDPCVREA